MKRSIRWQAALLCLALLLPMLLLSACGRNLPVVMEYGTVRLEEDVYRYWLSCYRAQFAYDETEENIARLSELADLNIRKTVVAAALFDSYGLRFDEVARARIEAAMERLVENAGGTREQLDEAAAIYGIDYTGLKLAISYEQKASALYQYLFGSNGIYEIPVLQYENYYQKTYTHVKMVYIVCVSVFKYNYRKESFARRYNCCAATFPKRLTVSFWILIRMGYGKLLRLRKNNRRSENG